MARTYQSSGRRGKFHLPQLDIGRFFSAAEPSGLKGDQGRFVPDILSRLVLRERCSSSLLSSSSFHFASFLGGIAAAAAPQTLSNE